MGAIYGGFGGGGESPHFLEAESGGPPFLAAEGLFCGSLGHFWGHRDLFVATGTRFVATGALFVAAGGPLGNFQGGPWS